MEFRRLAHIACAALIAGTAFCMTFMAGCGNVRPDEGITDSDDGQDVDSGDRPDEGITDNDDGQDVDSGDDLPDEGITDNNDGQDVDSSDDLPDGDITDSDDGQDVDSGDDYPEVEITISFDGQDYVLNYTLYRNMYPQTVQHFIELSESGFYDGTIIHNYQSNYLYGGGYDYEVEGTTYEEAYQAGKDGDTEAMRSYYELASKEKEYATLANPANGIITPSVYTAIDNGQYVDPLDTLIGEFPSNQHKIESGALKQTYGCLTMYYTPKTSDAVNNKRVYLDKYGSAFGVQGDYTYNSATSLFRIYTYEAITPSSISSYCIFGTLNNTDVLDDLKTAMSEQLISSESFTIYVDNEDRFLGANSNEVTYTMASMPIVIKTVKITKC